MEETDTAKWGSGMWSSWFVHLRDFRICIILLGVKPDFLSPAKLEVNWSSLPLANT